MALVRIIFIENNRRRNSRQGPMLRRTSLNALMTLYVGHRSARLATA